MGSRCPQHILANGKEAFVFLIAVENGILRAASARRGKVWQRDFCLRQVVLLQGSHPRGGICREDGWEDALSRCLRSTDTGARGLSVQSCVLVKVMAQKLLLRFGIGGVKLSLATRRGCHQQQHRS